MDDERMETIVLEYLRKKGFKNAEVALEEEKNNQRQQFSQTSSNYEPSITNPVLPGGRLYDSPGQYKVAYSKLQSWVHSSLDLYKNELLRVLYPVYVHCFMELVSKGQSQEARTFLQSFREDHEAMHNHDLVKLEGLLTPQHLEESELATSLRQAKMPVKLCQYSFELLLQYLHSMESRLMLGIVNAHLDIKVSHGLPSPYPEEDEAEGITASAPSHSYNYDKEIHWGMLEDSLEDKLEKELAAEALFQGDGENKAEGEEGKKRAGEGGKAGGGSKKSKKAPAGKGSKQDASAAAAAPRVKPELPIPDLDANTEKQILDDLRNRAKLSSAALPSVSFYCFINTHNSLNCAALSADGALVAGGFSDSSVKVWDMAKLGERNEPQDEGNLSGTESNGIVDGKNTVLPDSRNYTLLRGHAGPVYAADFSMDGNFLLSASGDSTVRLWSMKFKSDFVCFKGHNYPVWDVKYCPMGHYFASSSHDRTARIWSVERTQPLRIMAGHLSDVDCVQWHVNCNYIATGSSDKTVRLWDVQTGECMRLFTGHRGMVLSLAMSPDGRYMASGDEDGAIMMWDLSSGRCVTPMLGHRGCVWSLAFSGEGSLLASGSADNTVRLWDVNASNKAFRNDDKAGVRRLRLVKTLPTKSTPVYSLRFSRRNLLLAAGAFSPFKPSFDKG